MKTSSVLLLIIFFSVFYSCSQNDDDSLIKKEIELDEKSAQLVEADNAFGLELFQLIRANSEEENLMISPLSVSLALAMAYNGADGNTQKEMEEVLKLNGLTPEQINNSYNALVEALQSLDKDVVFEIANAIFYKDGFSVKQNFLDINHSYYNAKVDALDFTSPTALETINGWVAEKTHDKINKIIDSLSPNDRMVLLNAIYFYGNWALRFDEEGTKMLPFNMPDGSVKEVAMMSKHDKLEYTQNDLFKAIKLPYGTGQYNMVVMLPNHGETSGSLINELTADRWTDWNKDFETEENVKVTMPRFKFGFEERLETILKEMGMIDAFSDKNADFSKISDVFLYISSVIHKTYIDVNETGTEAAAVTAIVFATTSVGQDDNIYFTVNKPFVFAITEKDTGAILFIGEVQNPEYEE